MDTYIAGILHDAVSVIRHSSRVNTLGGIGKEVVLLSWDDVLPSDFYVAVSVRSCLLVPEPQCMAYLVYHRTQLYTQFSEYWLSTSYPTNIGAATAKTIQCKIFIIIITSLVL